MFYDNILIEMSLLLNRPEPSFRAKRELPGIGRRPRTREDIRIQRNLPTSFMIVRQKPTQIIYSSNFISNEFKFSFADII